MKKNSVKVLIVIVPLLIIFFYVAFYSGPLAPISVTVATVVKKSVSPVISGIGTVEVRYSYKISPTSTARLKQLSVDVGDRVNAGEILGQMDSVDLDLVLAAQEAGVSFAEAKLNESQADIAYAELQFQRYEKLRKVQATTDEIYRKAEQDLLLARAGLAAAKGELTREIAKKNAIEKQLENMQLISPVDGVVVSRKAEPGITLLAGQEVVEVIDPSSLWLNVRFDQMSAHNLAAQLPASISLRSARENPLIGSVLRIEPLADSITEEVLAKIVFKQIPSPLPPIGELVEVSVELPELAASLVVSSAAIQRIDGRVGVWKVINDEIIFQPVTLKGSDQNADVIVSSGLEVGDRVVQYSEQTLRRRSRIRIVEHL